ncbi:protein lysB [Burkholderia ambifaria]|uniref:protein lysB n=1 Tax=Burkholderia ambifaria TaxID=152480 RepID=UPI0015889B81|nr:protein lysB [Burkholderia ambifaria]
MTGIAKWAAAVKWAGAAVVVLAVGGAVHYVGTLRADLQIARQAADDAAQRVKDRDQVIDVLTRTAADKADQQKQLNAQQGRIDAKLQAIHNETWRILHESPEARAWADTVLPAAIARLQAGPDRTGAGDYVERVPDGDALHAAGDGPAD